MDNNYYNSNIMKEYFNIAKNTNYNFKLLKEYYIFSEYIKENDKICEFWSWEWSKIASFYDINKKLNLYWIDISEYWINESKKKYPYINYIVWDITKTNFKKNYFDITMSFFVYEHLQNPILAFQEMYRTTKKWWYIFLWFPNYWSPLFPSPPSLYNKSNIQKVYLILRRLLSKKYIYKNVKPITEVKFEPDFDTISEINMWKFVEYIKNNFIIKIIKESSNWEDIKNWNILFKLYFPFKIFKYSFFKYWWPKCFLIIKKNSNY